MSQTLFWMFPMCVDSFNPDLEALQVSNVLSVTDEETETQNLINCRRTLSQLHRSRGDIETQQGQAHAVVFC